MIDKKTLLEFSKTLASKKRAKKRQKHQAERARAAVVGVPLTFTIEPYEQLAMTEWMIEHKKTCSLNFEKDGSRKEFPGGAIGGAITYNFTPTGIGVATTVSCHCGESVNITDYEQW